MPTRSTKVVALVMMFVGAIVPARAQLFKPEMKVPNGEHLSAARKMTEGVFAKLKAGKTEDLAKWIVNEVGGSWDASTKISKTNDFRSKMEIILVSPPAGVYGKLDGYDLIDESYLPGSDRYFRMVYISYHEGAPMIWEFRFYVKPDGEVAVHQLQWSEKNPFEFMSTGDMLLPRWYDD